MSGGRGWVFEPAGERAWWLDQAGARVVEWRGASARTLTELSTPAQSLTCFDGDLLAVGDGVLTRVRLTDGSAEVLGGGGRRPGAGARVLAPGPSTIVWVEPGALTLRALDLQVGIGCEWWPSEPRVATHAPAITIDHGRLRLAWCHVAGAVEVIELRGGGRPLALGRGAASEPGQLQGAAVLPPEFVHVLRFDHDAQRLAIAWCDDEGARVRLVCLANAADTELRLGAGPARILCVEPERQGAIVDRCGQVEWVSFVGEASVLADTPAIAGRVHHGRVQLGDAQGRAWWVDEVPT